MTVLNTPFGPIVLARKPANVMTSPLVSARKKQSSIYFRRYTVSDTPRQREARLAFAKRATQAYGQTGTVQGLSPAAYLLKTEKLSGYEAENKRLTKEEAKERREKKHALTSSKIAAGSDAFALK